MHHRDNYDQQLHVHDCRSGVSECSRSLLTLLEVRQRWKENQSKPTQIQFISVVLKAYMLLVHIQKTAARWDSRRATKTSSSTKVEKGIL